MMFSALTFSNKTLVDETIKCLLHTSLKSTHSIGMCFTVSGHCSHKSGRCAVELYWTLPCVSSLVPSVLHPLPWLPVLSDIEPPALRRKAATDKLVEKIVKHDSWPIQLDILSPPFLRLTSRKPLWLDLQPVDIKSRWRHTGITGSRLRWSILT